MKKTIMFVALAMCTVLARPTELIAVDAPTVKLCGEFSEAKQYVKCLVDQYSKKYKVSSSALMHTIENEDVTFDFDKQSDLAYKKGNRWGFPAGTKEKSYGLAQIHLPDHPDITIEQATDPEFAIEYMAKEFSQGHQRQWMGYEG